MRLNDAGRMIEQWWFELHRKFPTVEADEFVVMPNHFHGIVVIPVGADLRVGPGSKGARTTHQGAHAGAPYPIHVLPRQAQVGHLCRRPDLRPYRRLSNGLKR
jgi:REP element-mobilizing transposase RayT